LKNCNKKYLEQFKVFNTFSKDFHYKYGTEMFLSNRKNKEAFDKLAALIKLNNQVNN
jgi:hypothetical protein